MREKIAAIGDRVSPTAMTRLRTAKSQGRFRRANSNAQLRLEVDELRDLVLQLQTEIDETRRDNIRLAELTDIVENRLAGRQTH